MKTILIYIGLLLVLTACKNGHADKKQPSGSIKCYSGGKLFFTSDRIRRITFYDSEIKFTDMKEGKQISVSGDCVILYNN